MIDIKYHLMKTEESRDMYCRDVEINGKYFGHQRPPGVGGEEIQLMKKQRRNAKVRFPGK